MNKIHMSWKAKAFKNYYIPSLCYEFWFLKKKNLVVLCESVLVVIPVVGYGAASDCSQLLTMICLMI